MTAAQVAELHARLDALDLAAFALRHELEAATAATNAPQWGDGEGVPEPQTKRAARAQKTPGAPAA